MTIYRSSAKINLTLDVLSRRDDGYHDLASIVHTVGLYDALHFEFGAPFSFRCNISELESEENLCVRAAQLWMETARGRGMTSSCDVAMHLEKTIPFGAGLGGGSGNAAAVLLALSRRFDRGGRWVPSDVLTKIAARLGADVPLFLQGGAQKMTGIGDRLSSLPPLAGWTTIVQPPQTISTPQAYRAWDNLGHKAGRGTAEMMRVWNGAAPHLASIATRLHNDLRSAATMEDVAIEPIIAALKSVGALGAEMSGSGSAVFGMFDSAQASQAAADEMRRVSEQNAADWKVWVAPLVEAGVQVQSGARWIDVQVGSANEES